MCGGALVLLNLGNQLCIGRHGCLEALMESIFLCCETPQFATIGCGLGSSGLIGGGRLRCLVEKGAVFLSETGKFFGMAPFGSLFVKEGSHMFGSASSYICLGD